MSLCAAFMVPHPPLILKEIGRGEEKQVEKTINAYMEVAEEISKINPETIIISSPHAPYYVDCFYLSSTEMMEGSFSRFGVPEVTFQEEIDLDLVKEIKEIAREKDFPIENIPASELDHGTMVPLYFIRQKLPKTKIVVVGLSELSLTTNYQLGKIIQKAIQKLNKKVVFVASGDLSHKLQEYGPYGFVKEGPIYDERIMKTMSTGNFKELLEYDEDFLRVVAQCGHRSFTIMAGALDGQEVEAKELSHEDITGVGYGICTFYPKGELKERFFLQSTDPYVQLARESLNNYVLAGKVLSFPTNLPEEMTEKRAGVFVSIHKYGSLRGCIGTILPTKQSIAEEIIMNAISAGTEDPRFQPIEEKELEDLEIHVDVLTLPEEINSESMLDPKVYGVIVSQGFKRGVLLPDLEGIEKVEEQIEIAKRKAGIVDGKVTLQRFRVIRHK